MGWPALKSTVTSSSSKTARWGRWWRQHWFLPSSNSSPFLPPFLPSHISISFSYPTFFFFSPGVLFLLIRMVFLQFTCNGECRENTRSNSEFLILFWVREDQNIRHYKLVPQSHLLVRISWEFLIDFCVLVDWVSLQFETSFIIFRIFRIFRIPWCWLLSLNIAQYNWNIFHLFILIYFGWFHAEHSFCVVYSCELNCIMFPNIS